MLKAMRDNMKHLAWVVWVVILVFVLLVFMEVGPPGAAGGRNVAASLGQHEVTWSELQNRHRELQDRMRSIYGDQWSDDLARQLQLERRALEQIFDSRILLAEARDLGLRVGDEEVRRQVLLSFSDERGEFVGQERYELETTRRFGGPGAFEDLLREDLLLRKLQDVLTQTVYVPDDEVERSYREGVERAAIRYLLVPRDRFAEEARADRASLERHYREHREEFRLPEQRVIDYLLVDKGILRARLEIPEAELRAYYDERAEEFSREEQVQARHILLRTDKRPAEEAEAELASARRRIEAGEGFAAVAGELSEDPGSAARGGDLGFFGRGRMVPAFEEVAFGAEVGALIGPIQTDFGLHLLEVTARREGGRTPFEEAREAVRARLAAERVDAAAAELAIGLRSRLAETAQDDLRGAMEALATEDPAVRFATTEPFGAGDVVPGIGRSPELTEAVLALAPGRLAPATVATPRGPMVVRLAEVREPRVAPLEEVEDRVRVAVERERQQELASSRLGALRAGIEAGTPLEAAAAELGVELVETPEFGPAGSIQGLGFAPAVAAAALDAERGALVGPVEAPQGAVLFEVTERRGFDPRELAAEREEIRARLAAERAKRLLDSLILERRRELGGIRLTSALQRELEARAAGTS